MEQQRYILSTGIWIIISLAMLACNKEDSPVVTEQAAPEITAVTPDVGIAGTQVTIFGSNFSKVADENTVAFNGIPAEISAASETKIETVVPEKAVTGPVTVTVNGVSAAGPAFTVDTRLKFSGEYETQKYQLHTFATSEPDTTLEITTTYVFDIFPVSNNSNEIEVSGLENFMQDGLNSFYDEVLGATSGGLAISFDKDVTAEVRGQKFELNDVYYTITLGSASIEGKVTGKGILEKGTIIFSFEHTLTIPPANGGTGGIINLSGEVALELLQNQ